MELLSWKSSLLRLKPGVDDRNIHKATVGAGVGGILIEGRDSHVKEGKH